MLNVSGKARVFGPKVRFLPSGTAVCTFSLGNGSKNKDGTWKNWFQDAKAFGKQAEAIAELDKKDIEISRASISREEWEKDGVKRTKDVIVVWEFAEVGRVYAPPEDDDIPF